MKFDNFRDVATRYGGTYILDGDQVCYVEEAFESGGKYMLRLQPITADMDDEDRYSVDYEQETLTLDPKGGGYFVLGGKLVWASRIPKRRWKQGFSTNSYRFQEVLKERVGGNNTCVAEAFLKAKCTPLDQIEETLNKQGACFVSKFVGFKRHKGSTFICYRQNPVGLYDRGTAKVVKGYEFLEDELTRSGSDVQGVLPFSVQDLQRGVVEVPLSQAMDLEINPFPQEERVDEGVRARELFADVMEARAEAVERRVAAQVPRPWTVGE